VGCAGGAAGFEAGDAGEDAAGAVVGCGFTGTVGLAGGRPAGEMGAFAVGFTADLPAGVETGAAA
jgi:hypothetical protein